MAKKERRVYNPATAAARPLKREWVAMADGSEVCCWELTVGETMHMTRMSTLPEQLGGGVDAANVAFWQVLLSARVSDEDGALPVWPVDKQNLLLNLPAGDFSTLLKAVAKVNGMDPERGAAPDAFTAAQPVR